MKQKLTLIGAGALLALCAATVQAQPENGFSINGGLVNSGMSGNSYYGSTSYSSSGISLGVDYQIALGPNFSLNPFLMTSGESGAGDLAGTTMGHGMLGLQLRYWAGDVFFGGHIASYSEVITYPYAYPGYPYGGTSSVSGPGYGLVAGWESPYSGVYVMGQLDSAHFDYSNASVNMTGLRLSVGYRWK